MDYVIFGAMPVSRHALKVVPDHAVILAADIGWQAAQNAGLPAQAVFGDFDSGAPPATGRVYQSPAQKDDTDTMLAVRYALMHHASSITLLGCTGGRVDHTIANLQTLLFLAKQGVQNYMVGDNCSFTCVPPGEVLVPNRPGFYFSVFAIGGTAEGVTLKNVKYPLYNAVLTEDSPLGVSNEIEGDAAVVQHSTGYLLLVTAEKE